MFSSACKKRERRVDLVRFLPLLYTVQTRGGGYFIKRGAQYDVIPLVVYLVLGGVPAEWGFVFGCLASYLAASMAYEVGYILNDTVSVKFEKNPTLRTGEGAIYYGFVVVLDLVLSLVLFNYFLGSAYLVIMLYFLYAIHLMPFLVHKPLSFISLRVLRSVMLFLPLVSIIDLSNILIVVLYFFFSYLPDTIKYTFKKLNRKPLVSNAFFKIEIVCLLMFVLSSWVLGTLFFGVQNSVVILLLLAFNVLIVTIKNILKR